MVDSVSLPLGGLCNKGDYMTQQLNIPFAIKSHQEDGFFCGYASVFNVTDHHQEKLRRHTAFSASLAKWKEKGRMPKMLWQHDQRKPIGVWEEIYEDEHGLYVKGRLLLDLTGWTRCLCPDEGWRY
jgi:phage head maturation protease